MNLVGKRSKSPSYVIDITGTDPLCLGELGERLILKNKKNDLFLTYERVIGSEGNFIFGRSLYPYVFKSRPDSASLGERGGGNLGKHLKRIDQDETWWEE